jgi:transposase, IS5 family
MRIISEFETQFKLGQESLSKIKLCYKSRDDITRLLLGLQHIAGNRPLMSRVFQILKEKIGIKVMGRSGMSLWRILVLGLLRQVINADYDRLCNLANNHIELRKFLGHGMIDNQDYYSLQTIKDNVALLGEEVLDKINILMVQEGHTLLDTRLTNSLNIKTDSFVVQSNVHYPTDTSLLFDAMRYLINLIATLANKHGLSGWREDKYYLRKIKTLKRKAASIKRSTSKIEEVIEKRNLLIVEAHRELIGLCQFTLKKLKATFDLLKQANYITPKQINLFQEFIGHANRQINQIYRRIILKETIPHNEKLFSLFNPFTEWISKGKAGVPVELGLRVSISTDQHGFILTHRTMEKEQDVDVAIPMIKKALGNFDSIYSASFDRGYYSPLNQIELDKLVTKLVMPKKGKISKKAQQQIASDHEYKVLRKKHSSVESNINALECHALDRCPDRGIENFRKYISMSVLAHNIHNIGTLVQTKLLKKERRRKQSPSIAA